MKKILILSIVGSVFLISSVFAEPYKGKAFPEKQVIKWYCAQRENCSYLGKSQRVGVADYNVYFTVNGSVPEPMNVFQIDTGLWIMLGYVKFSHEYIIVQE